MALNAATIGWDLENAAIARLEPEHPESLAAIDVLFLSVERLSTFWSWAVGSPVRSFRSATHEREAWRRLATFNRQLRRLLERGGLLVCRLDQPGSYCRVGTPPTDDVFPVRHELNAYLALSAVCPELATLANNIGRPSSGAVEANPHDHPLSAYVHTFAGLFSPAVAVVPPPAEAQSLALTPAGYTVALAWDQIACLPATRHVDPRHEAESLLSAVERWQRSRAERTAAAISAGTLDPAVALQADLARPIRNECQFTQALARALQAIGLPVVDNALASNGECVLLSSEVQTLPALPGETGGFLVHGRLRIDPEREHRVAFFAPPGDEASPGSLLVQRSQRDGEALVSMPELLHAVSAVAASPSQGPAGAQVRHSLAECVGLYRFDRSRHTLS